jgi:hypothetical protein
MNASSWFVHVSSLRLKVQIKAMFRCMLLWPQDVQRDSVHYAFVPTSVRWCMIIVYA